ncbi:MAG TPA: Hsp20 family protein [Aigarchaeota archaeon]|nr:Hsp20 family protein [Aigarchaeota archaeon]
MLEIGGKPNSAKASYNNGVLEVTLAKKEEEKKGQRIKVE